MTKEALQTALEALTDFDYDKRMKAIESIKEALETKYEPFEYWNAVEGWVKIDEVREHFESVSCGTIYKNEGEGRVPLYITPQRTWVGLTEEDLKLLSAEWRIVYGAWMDDFARDIEAKLKDKNNG